MFRITINLGDYALDKVTSLKGVFPVIEPESELIQIQRQILS